MAKRLASKEVVRAVAALRRAPFYSVVRAYAQAEMEQFRRSYESTTPASEEERLKAIEAKALYRMLFLDEFEVEDGTHK